MKKSITIFLSCISCISLSAQLTIGAGTTWTSVTGTYVTMDKMPLLYHGNTNTLGNTFRFTGSSDSYIGGTVQPFFSDVEINLPATYKVTLNQSIHINHWLNFQGGLIDLNTRIIDLGNTGSLQNESETSRIIGGLGGYVQVTADLNAPVSMNPGNLGAILTSSSALGITIIRRGHMSQNITATSGISILRYYRLIPANNAALNATVRLKYFDQELNGLNENSLVMWQSPNQVSWTELGYNSRDAINNFVEKAGIDTLSYFTLSRVGNPLPVNFISFKTDCRTNEIALEWKTAQEFNSSHFNIERSVDGSSWHVIASIPAAGNSTSERSYSYHDAQAFMQDYYYRLTEVDIDGRAMNSPVRRAACTKEMPWNLWPNPVSTTLWVSIYSSSHTTATAQVFNSLGQLVYEKKESIGIGQSILSLDTRKLAAGTYHLSITWNDGQNNQAAKFVKL